MRLGEFYESGTVNGYLFVANDRGLAIYETSPQDPRATFIPPKGQLLNSFGVRRPADFIVSYGNVVVALKLNPQTDENPKEVNLEQRWHSRSLGGLVAKLDCEGDSILADIVTDRDERYTLALDPNTGHIKGKYRPITPK